MVTAYLRVSTDRQTTENQRSEILRFAKSKGLKIDKWVAEIVSGKVKDSDRKLGALIRRLGKGDVLIVSELSRLSRTLLNIMAILSTLINKGVTLYSTKENCRLGDDINSKVLVFAFGLAAELERDLISMRTKEALEARREQGIILGRKKGSSPKKAFLEQNRKAVLEDLASGMKIGDVCSKYGVSRSTMRKFLLGA